MAFVNVEGEVSRVHNSGNGFGLKESWQVDGNTRSRFWAVFPKQPIQVQPGDRVRVSGGLQTSVTDPKTDMQGNERRYVDHVVGSASVEVAGQPQQAQQAPQSANNSPWGSSSGSFENDAARPF